VEFNIFLIKTIFIAYEKVTNFMYHVWIRKTIITSNE